MTMKRSDRLTTEEKVELYEALDLLRGELGWPAKRLALYLGYQNPKALYGLRERGGAVPRERYEKIMQMVESATLPSEVEPTTTTVTGPEHVTRAGRLWDDLKARGVRADEVAKAIGYTSKSSLWQALRIGHFPLEKYNALVRFAEARLGGQAASAAPAAPVATPPAAPDGAVAPAAQIPVRRPAPPPAPRRGIAIFVYIQDARDLISAGAERLEEGAKAANVLTAPGVRQLKARVMESLKVLDEVLALQ